MYFNIGNYEKAIEDFSAVIKIKPDDHEAMRCRGFLYFRKALCYDKTSNEYKTNFDLACNDGEAAAKICRLMVTQLPNFSLRKTPNQSMGKKMSGILDDTIENYTEALKIKPDDYNALYNRGWVYYKKGNYDKAIEDYTAVLKIQPNDYDALYRRGCMYILYNYNKAINDLEAASKINPNLTGAKQLLEEVRKIKSDHPKRLFTKKPAMMRLLRNFPWLSRLYWTKIHLNYYKAKQLLEKIRKRKAEKE